jgi:molybdenum cofactor cytidylyltransferase
MKKVQDGIILAAGYSSRVGAFKMGLMLEGKPLIHHTIETMRTACSQIIVVAGHKIEEVVELTKGFPGLRVVFNPNYPTGMFSSVKEGFKYVTSEWFFYIPGDYPLVSAAVYEKLMEASIATPDRMVFIPTFNSRKGHPVLMNLRIKATVMTEPQDSNLKAVINRTGFVPVPVDDEAILIDIDTMKDYREAVKKVLSNE